MESIGKDLGTVKKAILKAVEKIDAIRKKRMEMNDESKAVLANLANDYGLHPDAVRLALKVRDMDPENRRHFDIAYGVIREVLGDPVQGNLFETAVALGHLEDIVNKASREGGEQEAA